MNLKQTRYILAIAAAGVLLSGCGGGGGNGSKGIPPISSTNPVQTGTLEFAVGTANFAGVAGMNVVATYRQANGLSNVLVDTPTITGPFTLPAATPVGNGYQLNYWNFLPNAYDSGVDNISVFPSFDGYSTASTGPSVEEVASRTIGGTSQLVAAGTAVCDQLTACANGIQPNTSTFGQAGGVFTNGFAPANITNQGVAQSNVPYPEPLYQGAGATFTPYGGPPAFDPNKDNMGLRDGLSSLAVVGIPEGFTMLSGVTPSAGTYTLSLAVPTGFNGSTPTIANVSTTAKLTSAALLPTLAAPTLTLDGLGGGTVTLPAADFSGGISEVYMQIADTGNGTTINCQSPNPAQAGNPGGLGADGSGGAVYYTIIAKAAGTYTLPNTDGPNTNLSGGTTSLKPSESICTAAANTTANAGAATPGDNYSVQIVGLDYDMYGATYPITTSATPTLTGANGQADITVSPLTTGTSP